MKELLSQINAFEAENQRFAIATVINTWGSAPRPVGSSMLVTEGGHMSGSVSGGCVEGAVVRASAQVLAQNQPKRLGFGVSDEEAWAVGLSCGGQIQVFVEPFLAFSAPEIWSVLRGCLERNEGCVLLTELTEERAQHALVLPDGRVMGDSANENLVQNALRAYAERKNQTVEQDGQTWFIQVFPRKAQLIIVGAAHISVDLVHLAQYFGFETIVIDPRGIFSEKMQFPTPPDQLFVDWPAEILPELTLDAYTFAVMLTHDPKIDDQALHLLLRSDVAYIGALGSKKTHEKRVKRLTEAGFSETDVARINAPIGVAINAKSAREIALSIIAELIKAKNAFL